MIDTEAKVIEHLNNNGVSDYFGGNVWAGYEPPSGYKPTQIGLVVQQRSVNQDYSSVTYPAIFQFVTYGPTLEAIRNAELETYQKINDVTGNGIIMCRFNQAGPITPSDRGNWLFSLSLYNFVFVL